MKKSAVIGIIIILVVVLGAWWLMSMNQPQAPATTGTDMTGTPAPTGVGTTAVLTLNTMTDPKLGTFLVASNGMTLYMFKKDAPGVSNCSGQCAALWPPYTVTAGASLKGGLGVNGTIATINRTDGTMQVTYNGTPLYFWAKDKNPGDTTGQGFNNLWYVLKP